jgi:hypothetical protein
MNIIFNTLSIGYLYELYTRFYIKQLDLITDFEINFCITSDQYFGNKINSKKIKCYFNILDKNLINNTHKSNGINKTTCFKYYYKSLALKYCVSTFPNLSICHTDCDIIPNKQFNLNKFLNLNKSNTIYCPNTVSCSGGYGGPYKEDGKTLNITPKLKYIMDKFMPNFNDYTNLRCPIENILFFNKIPQHILLKYCEDWLNIGIFAHEKGYPTYGDCFEIKPAALINGIEIEQTSHFPFCDSFKGKFIELVKEKLNSFDTDEDFIDFAMNEISIP